MSPAIAFPRAPVAAREKRASNYALEGFVVLQMFCQVAILFSEFASFRAVFRTVSFGVSLFFLVRTLRSRGKPHPARIPAVASIAILAVSFFHPTTNAFLSGLAQIGLYVAILSPVFWVTGDEVPVAQLRRVLLLLWAFHVVSSIFGILQVYYPGKFQPVLSAVVRSKGHQYVRDLQIRTATGERVFRPMGLTDIPGGAANSGFYAALFGVALIMAERSKMLKAACASGIVLGLTAIYLSQVRAVLIMAACCWVGYNAVLLLRKEAARLAGVVAGTAAVVAVSYLGAVSLGGDSVTSRLNTLVEGDPAAVYYKNRGHFLEQTVNVLLPEYPFGAGLGRWGMMNFYFGDNSHPETSSIWVEIQWTGWLLDGGVPLILTYSVAILITMWLALKIALTRADSIWQWGAAMLAYDIAALAVTFSYPLFLSQSGLEFWLLNTTFFAAACQPGRKRSFI
ncbi:MAG: hypothetical protein U0Q16_17990 [Bryobacteraceae bacterium]